LGLGSIFSPLHWNECCHIWSRFW